MTLSLELPIKAWCVQSRVYNRRPCHPLSLYLLVPNKSEVGGRAQGAPSLQQLITTTPYL